MPLPLITLSGTVVDSAGDPAVGFVTFKLTSTLYDQDADITYVPQYERATFDGMGSFSIDLVASQGVDAVPQGIGYKVNIHVEGEPRNRRYIVILDESMAPAANLSDLPEAEGEFYDTADPVPLAPIAIPGPPGPPGPAGPQGEPGAPGSSPQFYLHEQGAPADVWEFDHNLGYEPAGIVVTDSGGSQHEGYMVEYLSAARIRLTFRYAFGGTARLS